MRRLIEVEVYWVMIIYFDPLAFQSLPFEMFADTSTSVRYCFSFLVLLLRALRVSLSYYIVISALMP